MSCSRVLRVSALALALGFSGASAFEANRRPACPGSPASIHASAQITVLATASCSDAKAEVEARVDGQGTRWHDPHNNGIYKVLSSSGSALTLSRTTHNGKYTDKLTLTFVDAVGGCQLLGCSESQVFSIMDFSTNYCNLRMLYCGSSDGCSPVLHDFSSEQQRKQISAGAGSDPRACLATAAALQTTEAGASPQVRRLDAVGSVDTSKVLQCVAQNCPMNRKTLEPSEDCVLDHCGDKVNQCQGDTSCNKALECEKHCTAPLSGTGDAGNLADALNCVSKNCHGLYPSGFCVAVKCGIQMAKCFIGSKCNAALMCARSCIPHESELIAV